MFIKFVSPVAQVTFYWKYGPPWWSDIYFRPGYCNKQIRHPVLEFHILSLQFDSVLQPFFISLVRLIVGTVATKALHSHTTCALGNGERTPWEPWVQSSKDKWPPPVQDGYRSPRDMISQLMTAPGDKGRAPGGSLGTESIFFLFVQFISYPPHYGKLRTREKPQNIPCH